MKQSCTIYGMSIQNDSGIEEFQPDELLSTPFLDLLEKDVIGFAHMLRKERLPEQQILAALDQLLLHRTVRTLQRDSDVAALNEELGALRRLVPHARRTEVDAGRKPWASRWEALGDLVGAAAEMLVVRPASPEMRLAHGQRVLRKLVQVEPCSQVRLAQEAELKPANLSRILSLLEANGLISRRAEGREKYVSLTDAGRECLREERSSRGDLVAISEQTRSRGTDAQNLEAEIFSIAPTTRLAA